MLGVSPNPPMDTEGRREDSGRGVRELQGRCSGLEFGQTGGWRAVAGAFGGAGGGLQWLWRAKWRDRHGERGSRTGMARVGGDVQLAGRWDSGGRAPSGREWNGSQPRRGASDLLLPRPALGKMQGEPAGRAGEPACREKNRRRSVLVVTIRSPGPVRAVQRARLCAITGTASQAALAAKRPGGMWFSPAPYLRSRMAFSIPAWRRWSASSSPPVPRSLRPGR